MISEEKDRITAMIYVSADGDLPYRPCFSGGFQNIVQLFQAQFRLSDVFHSFASLKPATDFNFPKSSSKGMKKRSQKRIFEKSEGQNDFRKAAAAIF